MLRDCTWNGHVILHQDARACARKMNELKGLTGRNDVIALQETHVNKVAMELELAAQSAEWRVFLSSHEVLRTGGTALLVRVAAQRSQRGAPSRRR